MSTTGRDIARKLGLSQPTVSRVLSGSSKQIIADETRRRVEDAAREMGYRPNTLARRLRIRRTDTIGFYVSPSLLENNLRLSGEFWTSMKRACDSHGLDILIHTNKRDETPSAIFEEIVGGRTDGALVYLAPDSPLSRYVRQSSFPIVSIDAALRDIVWAVKQSGLDPADLKFEWNEIMNGIVDDLVDAIRRPIELRTAG